MVEEYAGGHDPSQPHYGASVTKSVASILLGIAMDRGLLPGLEDHVVDRVHRRPLKGRVRLGHQRAHRGGDLHPAAREQLGR